MTRTARREALDAFRTRYQAATTSAARAAIELELEAFVKAENARIAKRPTCATCGGAVRRRRNLDGRMVWMHTAASASTSHSAVRA